MPNLWTPLFHYYTTRPLIEYYWKIHYHMTKYVTIDKIIDNFIKVHGFNEHEINK
jgi:hypothetical protein